MPMSIQPVQTEKFFLQKFSAVCAVLCFISAFICIVLSVMYSSDLTKVYRASLGASTFFFVSVGVVLRVMADTNLPGAKVIDPKLTDNS